MSSGGSGFVHRGQAPAGQALQGKLIIAAGQAPALETGDRRTVRLTADEDTTKILNDSRLNGFEVEARGHFTAPDRFLIDPIHTRALLVHRDSKLKLITYFCDVCNIRAYIPGLVRVLPEGNHSRAARPGREVGYLKFCTIISLVALWSLCG